MNILEKIHCEWWQALLLLLVVGMYPVFKAIAVILLARFVRADLAKLALPLILTPKAMTPKKPPGKMKTQMDEAESVITGRAGGPVGD